VFCALFRNPGVLAKAATTIDHICNGRADIGVGAGWFEEEFREFGYGYPPLGERLDQLEEAVIVMRSLWREDATTFKGKYYSLDGAVCSPKPRGLRLWMGGFGKERTPLIAAKYADGFNLPYLPPELVQDRLGRLSQACEKIRRDPASMDTSVNVGFYMGNQEAPDVIPGGALLGSAEQAIDRLREYEETGVRGVNIAFRPPIDWDEFERFIEEVLPSFSD
jgi:alkanesulfonate monooxygenase SsuD/methylene tetrahydromethanopterin reductase-like flavin-dependent oxidoreductase (luciferase family)